jgi:hypothetical protein
MPSQIITSQDIKLWAERTESQAYLPALLYKLINGSGSALRELDFPAGEGVQLGGWDGVVVAAGDHPHVPDGTSVWELSVKRGVRAKAEADYKKRTADPGRVDPRVTTYVAVTARSSNVISRWASEKRAEPTCPWSDVRGYDANRLASWIESLPAVALWFAGLIGKVPVGVIDPDTWWSEWAAVTTPTTSHHLVLAGMNDKAQTIANWASGIATHITLSAATEDEATAIAVGALRTQSSLSKRAASTWIVRSREAWTQVAASAEPLILVAQFSDRAGVEAAVRNGHHVLIPLDNADPHTAQVQVSGRPWEAVRNALAEMGLRGQQLDEVTAVGRLSLSALRRRLALIPGISVPAWAQATEAAVLVGPLLAGSWDDDNVADRGVVAALSGAPYEAVLATARRWANQADPPIQIARSLWRFVDRLDAWLLLYRAAGREHLDRMARVAVDVLGELDPKFELPVDQQYAAAVHGKTLAHSQQLRQGLADMIALLAATSDSHPLDSPITGQESACRIVRALLERLPPWHTWASLSPHLPLLAEACPDEFVRALESALDDPEFVPGMFTDHSASWMASAPHSGLLWALEVLAWSRDYLGDATDLLARLAEADPGGRHGNRPIASLMEIYKLWHPCTAAALDVRQMALSALAENHPEMAWQVLGAILPQLGGVAHITATPHWRSWAVDIDATSADVAAGVAHAVELMLELAGGNAERWIALIDLLGDVPEPQFDQIARGLATERVRSMPEPERSKVWDELRKMVTTHREFPDARWALPSVRVDRLAGLLPQLAPNDPVLLYGWVFTDWPEVPGRRHGDWNRDQKEIRRLRLEALNGVLDSEGVEGLLAFARRVASPRTVGEAVAEMLDAQTAKDFLISTLNETDDLVRSVGLGLLVSLGRANGTVLAGLLATRFLSAAARADILSSLPFVTSTWELVAKEAAHIQRLYWERVSIYQPLPDDTESLMVVADALVRHELYEKAIHLLVLNLDRAPSELIIGVLLATAHSNRDLPLALNQLAMDVPRLLARVSEADVSLDVAADLEWTFLPLIQAPFHQPKALVAKIRREPGFFVQILERIYRRSDAEPSGPVTYEQRGVAAHAFLLLHNWAMPPGCNADGSIDEAALVSWVYDARRLAEAAAVKAVADNHIGEILARVPGGSGQDWPPAVLGRVLEECRSPALERGLSVGLQNLRGRVMKAIHEGGAQERTLAEYYRSTATRIGPRFPRLARVLRQVASRYEAQARAEDTDAEFE